MKVGIVCPYDLAAPGGVQQLVSELAAQLRAYGDDAIVVAAGTDARLRPEADEAIVAVGRPFSVRANESVVPLALSPFSRRRIRRALADVDVVHVHEPLVPVVGWFALGVGQPTVATFHAAPPRWVPVLYRGLPVARRMRKAVLTAVSRTAARALPERWGRVEVIPNAVDVASYNLAVGRLRHRVCFLGRDDPRKGLDVLLAAWPAVRSVVPEAELVVMGADRRDRIDGVDFLGRIAGEEKRQMLCSSLVCVAPNTGGESFGIVIAEAMAAGCAVVASDLAAFRNVAADHADYVPPGDQRALASAIVALLVEPDHAEVLGTAAREHAGRYDWAEVVGRYRDAYRMALGLAAAADR